MDTRTRVYILLFFVFGLCGILAGTHARAWAQTAPVKPLSLDMQTLLKTPAQYKQQAVAFACRFTKEGGLFRQGSARFTDETHVNFMVWPVEAPLWDKSARRQILPSLYISRDNAAALTVLRNLSRYDTVKIIGIVEEAYANLPWISVAKIVPIPGEHLDDAMLQQVARGSELLKNGDKRKAQLCFELATGQGAPAFVRQYIQTITADYAPQRVIEQKPVENYMPIVEAAREAARNKDLHEAEKLYLSAQHKCADNAWLYKEIGLFYEYEFSVDKNSGKLDQALNAYKKAEMLNGTPDADIQFLLARATFLRDKEEQHFDKAEMLLNKCLELNREHAQARRLAAEITAEKIAAANKPAGNNSEVKNAANNAALAVAPKAPHTRPENIALRPEQHFQIGSTLVNNNNFESAVKHLQAAAESKSPCAGEARLLLVSSLYALNRHAEAEAILKQQLPGSAVAAATPAAQAQAAPAAVSTQEIEKLSADMDALNIELESVRPSLAANAIDNRAPVTAAVPAAAAAPALRKEKPAAVRTMPPAAEPAKPAPAASAAKTAAPADAAVSESNVSLSDLPDWAL